MENKSDFIIRFLNEKLGDGTARVSDIPSNPPCIMIDKERIVSVCTLLRDNPSTSLEMLQCISGIDNGPAAGTMEVIYNVTSITLEYQIALRVILPRPADQLPHVDTVSGVWRTADWLERETYDLLGIDFKGHPDLRRILLPHDWTGHPLRKDYKTDEYYHNVKIDY
jgi:NADH-quinone oxidoreductase subunit C